MAVEAHAPGQTRWKSVQEYIDELPIWSDGTNLKTPPMTNMQWRIWTLAAAGKFFEGFVVFMTGVALPLIVREFHLRAADKGIVGAASLAGILFGALLLGGLSDLYGRKRMFIAEMIIFCAFLALLIMCTNFTSLAICLFSLGMALGCDYPTAHMIISESTPSSNRGKLVIGAFGFQALGALAGTGVGCLVLILKPELTAWRWMFATVLIPAILVTIGRFYVTESPSWLVVRGAHEAAEKATDRLLRREPRYPKSVKLARPGQEKQKHKRVSFLDLFDQKNRRATIFASVPWFIQDLSTYGIGIFTPTILAAALGGGPDRVRSLSDAISEVILAAKGAALINILLIVGILFAVILADRLGRIRLQIVGFVGCAIGLLIASFSVDLTGDAKVAIIFVGFMLFNFMTNLGPNSQTYLLAGEVFPTRVRGMGAGFAAAFAKMGAVSTAFLFPILLQAIGTRTLLYMLAITSVLGALVTWQFRIETTGVKLDRIGETEGEGEIEGLP
ncbi:MAG: MFS transporter [Candidatus Binataceae bacterium]